MGRKKALDLPRGRSEVCEIYYDSKAREAGDAVIDSVFEEVRRDFKRIFPRDMVSDENFGSGAREGKVFRTGLVYVGQPGKVDFRVTLHRIPSAELCFRPEDKNSREIQVVRDYLTERGFEPAE